MQPGDIITYNPFSGSARRVRVSEVCEDIKNGQPGFCGTVVDGPEAGLDVWGYDRQVVR